MWYAIQVKTGTEQIVIRLIESWCAGQIEQCFLPLRERRVKRRGEWKTIRERLFPGYVFVVSENPVELFLHLKSIPRLTRILGREEDYFIALSEKEVDFLRRIGGDDHVAALSQVTVSEGNQVRVVGGSLLGYTGQIVKINLHKRIAVVRVEFMGRMVDMYLGIEILEKVEETTGGAR